VPANLPLRIRWVTLEGALRSSSGPFLRASPKQLIKSIQHRAHRQYCGADTRAKANARNNRRESHFASSSQFASRPISGRCLRAPSLPSVRIVQKTVSKKPSNELACLLHVTCTGTRGRNTPMRPTTGCFTLRRTSESNSGAWRPYTPQDLARHYHHRCRTSGMGACCGKAREINVMLTGGQNAQMLSKSKRQHSRMLCHLWR
jgi:hypothetical protein